MTYDSNILLGRITKVNGYEGAVTVKLEKRFFENITLLESVFLEIEGRPVPFFISSSEYSGADILKLKFEGYDSIDRISEFTGCRVFLTSSLQPESHVEDIHFLEGYQVYISGDELLGSIIQLIQNPGQWLLSIQSVSNKNILVPFHENLIVSIDKKKKTIIMDIPEGLKELN
jgi:16S rRNA processing protein RimM